MLEGSADGTNDSMKVGEVVGVVCFGDGAEDGIIVSNTLNKGRMLPLTLICFSRPVTPTKIGNLIHL